MGSPADRTFAGYHLLEELGRGNFGSVHSAEDPRTGRRVAVKRLHRGQDQLAERFEREAQLTAALNHPGIVRIHAYGVEAGEAYVVYEQIEGARSLDVVLAPLAPRDRLSFVRDTARAVGHAHAKGIVHRDLKPDNVLVDASGRVRVVDFGIAFAVDLERLTQTGVMVGTPYFMSPEQITGDRSGVGPWSDVWALGVLLHWALTNAYPFSAPNAYELMGQITRRRVEFTLPLGVPSGVESIVRRALEKAPPARYAHGDAFADALDEALEEEPADPRTRRLKAGALGAAALAVAGIGLGWGVASTQGMGASAPDVDSLTARGDPSAPQVSRDPRAREDPLALSTPRARHVPEDEPELDPQVLAEIPLLVEVYEASRSGNPKAMWNLAFVLRGSLDLRPDLKPHARYWLLRAADAGQPQAVLKLVVDYLDPRKATYDEAKGVYWLERGVELGIGECCQRLGFRVFQTDPSRAVSLFERGVEFDHAGCCAFLGTLLWTGDYVPQDRARALDLWRRGSAQKHEQCLTALGVALVGGADAPARQEGLRCLEQAASIGSRDAATELLHARGLLCESEDASAALSLYAQAAERGHAPAAFARARLLVGGAPALVDLAEGDRALDAALSGDERYEWRLVEAVGTALADASGPWDVSQRERMRAFLVQAREGGNAAARSILDRLR